MVQVTILTSKVFQNLERDKFSNVPMTSMQEEWDFPWSTSTEMNEYPLKHPTDYILKKKTRCQHQALHFNVCVG